MEQRQKKLGGMLIVAVLSFIITGLISISTVQTTVIPFDFNETWLVISNPSLITYNSNWVKFVLFEFSSSMVVALFTIVLFVLFLMQSRFFPRFLIIYFMVRVLIITFIFYFQTVIIGPPTPTLVEITTSAFRALIISGLWIPYIMLSETASETFIN